MNHTWGTKENSTKDMNVLRHGRQLLFYNSMLINVKISIIKSKLSGIKAHKTTIVKTQTDNVLKRRYIKVFQNSVYIMPFRPILRRY